MNCSNTEEIVSNMILVHNNCAAIQTVNTYLAQTTIDLYRILTNALQANNQMDNGLEQFYDELNISTDADKQWCIL